MNETLRWAAGLLGDAPPAVLVAATLLFVAGAFGVRLLGLVALVRSARSDATGLHAFVASTILAAVTASLVLRGHPFAIDGVQFLMFALYLSWLHAGPVVARAGGGRAWVAIPLAGLAMAVAGAFDRAEGRARAAHGAARARPRARHAAPGHRPRLRVAARAQRARRPGRAAPVGRSGRRGRNQAAAGGGAQRAPRVRLHGRRTRLGDAGGRAPASGSSGSTRRTTLPRSRACGSARRAVGLARRAPSPARASALVERARGGALASVSSRGQRDEPRMAVLAIVLGGLAAPSASAHNFAFTDVTLALRPDGTFGVDVVCDLDALALGVDATADSAALAAADPVDARRGAGGAGAPAWRRYLKRRVRVRFDGEPAPFTVSLPGAGRPRRPRARRRARWASWRGSKGACPGGREA